MSQVSTRLQFLLFLHLQTLSLMTEACDFILCDGSQDYLLCWSITGTINTLTSRLTAIKLMGKWKCFILKVTLPAKYTASIPGNTAIGWMGYTLCYNTHTPHRIHSIHRYIAKLCSFTPQMPLHTSLSPKPVSAKSCFHSSPLSLDY